MALKVTDMGRVKIDSELKKGFSRYISRYLGAQSKNTQGEQTTKDVANADGQPYPSTLIKKNILKIECGNATQKDNETTTSAEKDQKNAKKSKSQEKDQENDSKLEEIIKKITEDESIQGEVTPEGDDFIEIDPAKLDDFYRQIAHLFDQEEVEELARSSGFVKRKSKLTGHLFMTIFTFGVNIFGSPTLNQLVGLLDLVADVEITRQAFWGRVKREEAVTFFEQMLSLAINVSLPDKISINVLDPFNRVMILDSTAFQLPPKLAKYFAGSGGSASKAGVKIQFAYDLKSSQFVCLIQDGKTPDNRYDNSLVKYMKPGDLVMRDLGYSNTQVFIDFEKKGVYFVSRLKSDLKVYIKNDNGDLEEFDLDKYLSKMTSNLCELEIYLKKSEEELQLRLIIEKVPQEIKESRLRKLKEKNQKKGKTTSKRTRLREGFTLYISNVPAKMVRFNAREYENFKKLSPEAAKQLEKYTYERTGYIYIDLVKANRECELVIEKQIQESLKQEEVVILAPKGFRYIYSVRWQIELIFKNWKSNFDLDVIRVKNNEHFAKCLLYAKLMYILISTKITFLAKSLLWKKEQKEVSELQAGKHLKMMALTWMFFAIHAPFLIENMLKKTVKFLMCKCVKSKKKGKLWALEILQVLFMFV